MSDRVVAVVPIKLTNRRLPGKNLLPLGGRPLVCHLAQTLASCVTSGVLDAACVFCSDETVRHHTDGLLDFVRRDPLLDRDETRSNEILVAFAAVRTADIYVLAHATSPFTRPETVSACVDAVRSGKYDSAFTAERIRRFVWCDGQPVNFRPERICRTQDLPPTYVETSGVIAFRREVLLGSGRRTGERPYIAEVDATEAVDIDELADFERAERVIAMMGGRPC